MNRRANRTAPRAGAGWTGLRTAFFRSVRPAVFPAAAFFALLALLSPARMSPAQEPGAAGREIGGRIAGEVRLAGTVRVTEDVTVLPGARLVLSPGTVLLFVRSDSTKVDPEHFFGGTELVVRGELSAEGATFRFPDRTGGITVDAGKALLAGCAVEGAEGGLSVLRGGEVVLGGVLSVRGCRVGAALLPGGRYVFRDGAEARIERNGVGIVRFSPERGDGERFVARGNEEADVVAWEGPVPAAAPAAVPAPGASVLRVGDLFLDHDRTLSGDVVVDGIVRVAPGATLTIAPGSRLFFVFRDTDGDGIGENGIFLQGNLHCRGTRDRRIGFYPLDDGRRGRWDAINFMASDRGENVLEHVDVVGAYRGVHAHFSKVRGADIRIARCYRGLQFQESEVTFSRIRVEDASSALRGRDSTVRIDGFEVTDVVSGVNLFRSVATLSGFRFDRPGWYGFRLRDSRTDAGDGEVARALVAYSVQEGTVRLSSVVARDPGLSGFALQDGDVTITRSRSAGSRVDAVSATRARVTFRGGELSGFGRHAVRLDGPAEVLLEGVSVGKGAKGSPFHDGKVVPGLGTVRFE